MIRTQIQLPQDLHRRLKRWARQRDISLAEAVRRCVADRLALEEDTPTRAARVREAMAVAGAYRDPEGRSDIARDHDAELAKAYRK